MNRRFLIACFALFLLCRFTALVCADGNSDPPRKPDAELTQQIALLFNTPDFRAGFQGVCIASVSDGGTLCELNADRLFLPASNNKLLTSGAALALLGPRFRYHTRLFQNGALDRSGVLRGDLVLRGDGDPLLDFHDFRELAQRVKQAGIRRVTGKLYYDESRFDAQRLGDGWTWDDETFDYSAQISALNVNENVVTIRVSADGAAGGRIHAAVEPNLGYVTLVNRATVSKNANDAPLEYDRKPGTNTIVITGGLPKKARRQFTVTVDNPAKFSSTYFLFALKQAGIHCEPGGDYQRSKRENLRLIAERVSPPLAELLPKMNKPSDNLMAECLLKTIGSVRRGEGSAQKGAASIQAWLSSIGIKEDAVRMADGSGLSRYNEVSPRALVRLLTWLYRSPYRNTFFDSLPIAGIDGTLKNRLKNTAAQSDCRAKTGTLSHVSSLSGIVKTRDGETLAFSILMNNHLAAPKICHAAQDKIVSLLAEYTRPKRPTAP